MDARKEWFLGKFSQLESRRSLTYLGMVTALSGVLVTSRFLEPTTLPELCLFKIITGIECMFCGLTRGFHALSHGHFHAAIDFHPLAPLAYLLVVFHLVLASLRLIGWLPRYKLKVSPLKMFYGSFVFFTAFWIIRNLVLLIL